MKAAALERLRGHKAISKRSIISSEFRIPHSAIRADLAVLADKFIGIEIKSAADSLRRLSTQVGGYLTVFDRVIVVLASKHIKQADWSILKNVEVWEFDARGTIREIQQGSDHSPTVPLARLMTQNEKKRFGEDPDLLYRLLDLSGAEAQRHAEKESFAAAFRHRYGSTTEQFWRAVGRKAITSNQMVYLSRHHPRRHREREWREAQTEFWREWRMKAEQVFGRAGDSQQAEA
jgi:hypothetical protein